MNLPDDTSRAIKGLLESLAATADSVEEKAPKFGYEVELRFLGTVTVSLAIFAKDHPLCLDHIVVDEGSRSKGYGRQVMKLILDVADEHGATIQLYPRAFGRSPLSSHDLAGWYKRLGFKKQPGRMIRVPTHAASQKMKQPAPRM